jgi:hypothetical protein
MGCLCDLAGRWSTNNEVYFSPHDEQCLVRMPFLVVLDFVFVVRDWAKLCFEISRERGLIDDA